MVSFRWLEGSLVVFGLVCGISFNAMCDDDDRPPCNGQTENGTKKCGEGRGCNPANQAGGGTCAGTTVVQKTYTSECVAGTSSEYCASEDDVICTETFVCIVDPEGDPFQGNCIAGSPEIGNDGKPVNSTADGVLVSRGCKENPA